MRKNPLMLCLLSLAVGLAACGGSSVHGPAFRQAVPMPMPVEAPPAYTPGFAPGTPSEPTYTPPGTGLPMPGQPGYVMPRVKRSPNTRVLPDDYSPKKEPGLWAADGAPVASTTPPPLFGVTLPYPNWATEKATQDWPDSCIVFMHNASVTTGVYNTVIKLPEAIRWCMAARAYAICADDFHSKTDPADPSYELLQQMVAHGHGLVARFCPGSGWTNDHADVLAQVVADFRRTLMKVHKDHRRH
jgi:hypothetical protein